jgi:amidase
LFSKELKETQTGGPTEAQPRSVREFAALLQTRELRAIDVVEECLTRIALREPLIHAWTSVDPDYVRRQARELDAGAVRGLLHGLPLGVKDIFDTCDYPTEYGSRIYAGHRPAADAACVSAARNAGAIIVGKTATTEFATYAPAGTVNPHDRRRTPGGSSSGSAAAVADRMVPLAFGTQTAGSVIRPASYCGIVGYKPSFGLVPTIGVKKIAPSLDTIGAFGVTVHDAAFLIGALTGRRDLIAPLGIDGRLEVGICLTHEWPSVDDSVGAAIARAERRLADAGAVVARVELPPSFADLAGAYADIYDYEIVRNLDREGSAHRSQLSAPLRNALDAGAQVSEQRYRRAQKIARLQRRRFVDASGEWDVLLTPSSTGEAGTLESTGSPIMNRMWTLLHLPCVGVPAGRGPCGLPVGLQVVGRAGDDARVLAAAAWIEAQLV